PLEVELPWRFECEVNVGKRLLLLIAQSVESAQRAVSGIVLEPSCNLFCEIVAYFNVGRESHAPVDSRTVKRAVERGIETQVPATEFLVDNRTNLQCPRIRRECGTLIAE